MYLTPAEAEARLLLRYDIIEDSPLKIGDVMLASADLDELAPFKGEKTDPDQGLEFPRDGATVVPDAVLDWVALRAYDIQFGRPEGVTSTTESIGELSQSRQHAPYYSQTARRLQRSL